MLRLGCIERKEKGKTGGVGGPERVICHFGSSVATGFLYHCVTTGSFTSR